MKMMAKVPGFLIQWRLQYKRAKNHFRKERERRKSTN